VNHQILQVSGSQNENKERLALVSNSTVMGIWDRQVHTGALTFGQRLAKSIGYSVEELH
jgi:hypothetical protein